MLKTNNQQKFLGLREQYPFFIYEGFDFEFSGQGLHVVYRFNLADRFAFRPVLTIPHRSLLFTSSIQRESLENILFQIGMAEMISYWKAACPPRIIINKYSLTEEQERWWKKLFYRGLGEFRYLNGITVEEDNFVLFETGSHALPVFSTDVSESCIIPVGGGKDSVVTLELLGKMSGSVPFILNRLKASEDIIRENGFPDDQVIVAMRTIDPVLLELNAGGFLNGHTPFSALLAFVSSLTAILSGRKYIILSNESSANESTVAGTGINHQYSKSFEFETDFRHYLALYVTPDIEYFSFLRPLSEIQIAKIFSRYSQYLPLFRSCNAGSKTNSWCGKCSKCLFTYIILSLFLNQVKLEEIFGANLLDDPGLQPIMDELTGVSATKPFDCVGTVEEVNIALCNVVKMHVDMNLPVLLKKYSRSENISVYRSYTIDGLYRAWDENNFLPLPFEKILKSSIND
jgi:UDP-N-acetyl-alpha-D-muramoyl-L-alanyl-L-glutamate epimerase